jgi:hypothetical protein
MDNWDFIKLRSPFNRTNGLLSTEEMVSKLKRPPSE